jgi:hypothetical protein
MPLSRFAPHSRAELAYARPIRPADATKHAVQDA